MNKQNIDLIQSIFEAFGRGDVAFIAARTTAGARWDFNVRDSGAPWHRPATGPAELPRFFSALADNVDFQRFEPRRFIADGDDVVVHVSLCYRVRSTGKVVDEDQLQWWRVHDGKVAALRHFEDTAQVLAALH